MQQHQVGTREPKKIPSNSKVCSQDVHFPCFLSIMSLALAIRVNLRSDPDCIPDCTDERSLEKKVEPSDASISHGCRAGSPGVSVARATSRWFGRRALSLFLEVCVYSGFGDPYKRRNRRRGSHELGHAG